MPGSMMAILELGNVVAAMLCGEACQAADFVQRLRDSRKELRQAVRDDTRNFLQRVAQEASEAPAKEPLNLRTEPWHRMNARL